MAAASVYKYNQRKSDQELLDWVQFENLAAIDCKAEDVPLLQSLDNDAKYIGRKLTTSLAVPGNIHRIKYRKFWLEDLKTSDLVRKTIEEGYELPFSEIPPPSFEVI